MNAVTTTTPAPLNYTDLERLAASIAQSGLFGIKTKDQAIALMMIAHAEGRHPALAARDYDVIQGKPAKKAEAMMRDFIEAGGKVEWHALTDTKADATFTHPQTGSVRIDWDIERARTAGFAGKDNWKKFPRAMLRSRVVSEGVRTVWPLATSGMYVPEEQADIERKPVNDDHTGPTIEAEPANQREKINAEIQLRAAAAPAPRAERKVDPTVYEAAQHPLEEVDRRKWMDNLTQLLANAQTRDEVVEIAGHRTVGQATAHAPDAVKRRLAELLATAYGRFVDNDEVRVEGEEKVAAG